MKLVSHPVIRLWTPIILLMLSVSFVDLNWRLHFQLLSRHGSLPILDLTHPNEDSKMAHHELIEID